MGESAQQLPPLDFHLLDQLLDSAPPDLESSDERLERVNGLVSRGQYVDAARAAEGLLREGLYDVRLVGPYLLGIFLEGGLEAMPVVFLSLSNTLLRNWQSFGPYERKDVFTDGGLRWLLKLLNKHLEHHERLKDATWQRWRSPAIREPLEQALALSEEIFSAIGRVMQRNGSEAPFRRLAQWLEGHLRSLPVEAPPSEPEPEEAPVEERKPAVTRAAASASGPTIPVSPALAQLMARLAAFDTLIERQDFQRASVVAVDVMALLESFDPRVYLPSLFSRFFSGLSTHAEQVESLMQGTESLSFRALDQLYKVDLEAFLGEGSGGAED